jgi:peptide/nickel transport system permease protein
MMAIIGLVNWTNDARFIRAEFLRLRRQDFVQAAIASGLPRRSIIFRHMLPNGITPVLVNMPFEIAAAILYESTLSFLGLGLVDEPSWGQLLNQARSGGEGLVWWIATTPGLAIFLTVLSYNLIGEAVRDALDPKLRKRV